MKSASEIIDEVKADSRAMLYRCRWSDGDARRVVPCLVRVLDADDPLLVDEALRALFTIGAPAVSAVPGVTRLTTSDRPMTRHLATLALGQIAHKEPRLCVAPVTRMLRHTECRDDALRILKHLGPAAVSSVGEVASCYDSPSAKTRKLAVLAAIAIDAESDEVKRIAEKAAADRSKAVRDAVRAGLQKAQRPPG